MNSLSQQVKITTAGLLAVLSPRNRDVISRRFGLKTGAKETLESIGQNYDITRERVRQIEETSLRQIREALNSGVSAKIKPLVSLAASVLEENKGVLPEGCFFEKFFGGQGRGTNPVANSSLSFILTMDRSLKRHSEDDNFYPFWSLSDKHHQELKGTVASLVSVFGKNKAPVHEKDLPEFFKKTGVWQKQTPQANLAAYLEPSKQIAKNIFGEIGLAEWPEIKPKGVRDKSFLVLKKEKKPKHFTEIAQLINQFNFSDRRANVQTVHNELIKDDRFVLVGRGTYGLAEWGYKTGTVKDVLVDFLRSANKPLHRDEIIAHVLSHRMVKENTILLNLQNASVFAKKGNGLYELKEA